MQQHAKSRKGVKLNVKKEKKKKQAKKCTEVLASELKANKNISGIKIDDERKII